MRIVDLLSCGGLPLAFGLQVGGSGAGGRGGSPLIGGLPLGARLGAALVARIAHGRQVPPGGRAGSE
jgi:hypothetical protein